MDLKYILLIMGLVLLVGTASAALDGYAYSQTIDYTACDQALYQQDIVIHRTTGTAYNETAGGLETWHIYVGEHCREDYGDIRFTNSTGAELAYYLWPDYDSSSADFCVRLEGADAAGALTVWYGNSTATAVSTTGVYDAYHGSASSVFYDTPSLVFSSKIYEAQVRRTSASYNLLWGVANGPYGAGFAATVIQIYSVGPAVYVSAMNNGLTTNPSISYTTAINNYYQVKLIHNGTHLFGYIDDTLINPTGFSTNIPTSELGLYFWPSVGSGDQAWSLVRSYSATPPAALTFSGEQKIAAPPTTAFTATPTNGLAPLTVQFTDLSTYEPVQWLWDFGDGNTSSTQNPQHTYAAPGTYSVNLTATNEYGSDYELKADYITVYAPITAQFTATPTNGLTPLTVQFTDTSTGNKNEISWLWNFGDGETITLQNPSHIYTEPGTYTVNLTVTNAYGTDTMTKPNYITIYSLPIVAFTANKTSVYAYDPVQFTDQSTNDPFPLQSWNWSFGDGQWTNQSVNDSVTHAYAEPGTYTVELFVTGYGGTASKTKTVTVDPIPVPTVAFTANKTTVYPNETILFTDQTTTTDNFPMYTWNWSFGDDTWVNQTVNEPVTHAYAEPGSYTVELFVTGYGGTASKTKTVTVHPSLDEFTYNQSITYMACDQEIYQQDIVIHRSTGTAYEETVDGLKIWHLYVDEECKADYGDVRFVNSTGTELSYHLWPDFDGESARFVVRMEGATNAGTLMVYYGNPTATTTSNPDATYFLHDHFDGSALDALTWTSLPLASGTGSVSVSGGICTITRSGGNGWQMVSTPTFGANVTLQCSLNIPSASLFASGGFATGTYGVMVYANHPTAGQFNIVNRNPYPSESTTPIGSGYTGYREYTISRNGTASTIFHVDGTKVGELTGNVPTRNLPAAFVAQGQTIYIDYILVRAYSAAPPAVTAFNGENVVPPTTAFTATPTAGIAPLTVQFTDTSTGTQTPTSWIWDFGDGNTSTDQNPSHTYTTTGTYTVNLTVTNAYGTDTMTKPNYITIYSLPIVAFTANKTSVYAYDPVQFTDQSTNDRFPMQSWNWSFGDGAWINQSVNDSVTYAYDEPGTYTVELFVTGYGGTASKTKTVTVYPIPVPTVAFTANKTTVYPNETILFTDKTTTTDNFPMYTWNWSFGDGQWTNQSVNDSVEHAYVAPGSYDVTLYVTGEGGTGSKTLPVTVEPFPVPIVQFTANATTAIRPMSVQFTDLSTYEPYQWYWDFGDGYDSTDQNPVHTYRYEGTYAVTLTAWNVNGQNSTTKTGYITVNLPPLPTLRDLHIQNNGMTVTDYQVSYEVANDTEFFGLLQSNPAHLEVYNGAGDQSYYFWIESFNTMTNSSKIWIKIPTLTGGGAITPVRLKYNDNREIPLSDGDHTFLLFDAFDTVGINDEEWQIVGSPTQSVGSLRLAAGDSLVSTPQYPYHSIAIDARVRTGGSDLDLALSTAGTNWKSAGDGFGLTVNGDLTARAVNDGSVTTETVPIVADAQYHTYTIYEIDSNLVYQRDGITQKVIGTNQPDTDLHAVLQGDGEVDWIFVRKFSTQDYVYLVPPQAAFTADIVKGVAPVTVNFTDTSANSPTAWAWDFGDGQMSDKQNPTHTFTEVGNYTVTLTVTNLRGSDTYTATVQAVALIAIPEFGANITKGVAPLTVQFTDQSENVTAWAWNFGDGQTSTDQHPVHTFSNIGNWTVTLTGTNLHGSNTTSMVIAATLPPPVANFTQNVTAGDEPLSVQFTDESTHSPDRWLWAFGDGQMSTEQNPVHMYVDGGSYQVSLTVSSFAGTDTLTVPAAVTVGNIYVEPVAAFAASATTVDKGSAIKFTDQSTNEPLSWSWQFGDGQTSTSQNPTHTYTTPGTYSVTLTVSNPAGSNTTTETMTVLERMPVAAFSGTPRAGDHPMTVQFTDQTSNNPTAWSWDFGDGQTSTEQHPTHVYAAAGAYTVTLTATNVRGTDDEVKPEYIRVDVPDVAFTANVTDGNKPLIVQFTDESTKQPTAWLWNFGDGQTSTEQNPVHTYTTAGMKTVTLTATNANGAASLTKTQFIMVVELVPVAAFAPTSATIDRYQFVQFVDQSSNVPTKWEWAFGDGQTYTTTDYRYKNPNHQYTAPGTYTVTLKVTNAIGSSTATGTVTVHQIAPNAVFTATNTVGDAPLTVTFTDRSTNEPTAWVWDFGDGQTGTDQHPAHTYTTPGTYSVTLTTMNAAGSAAVTKTDLVVLNTPAVAMTVDPAVGEKSLTVRFTDQSTNEPTAWLWKFGDGQTSTEQNPTHVYTTAGVYTVTLTATNEYGTTTKSFSGAVTVYELAPVAAFTANVTEGNKPLGVQFTDLSTNNPTQWAWSFGDGTTSTLRHPVHTYTAPGLYTVTLTATNPKGSGTVTRTNYITVEEIPPVAAFTVDHTYMIAGQDIRFTDQSQNSPTTWFWQFGDGQTSSLKNPRHAYAAPGTYSVTLRVTNEKGQSDLVKINYITVDTHLPIADFDCNPVLGAAPLTVTFTDESEFLPYQWFWQFGDGVTSTVQHPTHTYREPGTYTVTLRSSNAVGSDTMTKTDVIVVQLPTVNFTATPTMGGSPLTVQFTTDGSPDWSYHWSFGDGATSNEQNPTHVYKTTQDQQFYTVSLTVAYGGEEQDIVKPNYIDVRTKSIETFMAEQQENITGVVAIGAVMATIAGIIVIYLGL